MIPAVTWSLGSRVRVGDRAAWAEGPWLVVWRPGTADAVVREIPAAAVAHYLGDAPADAWRGTAATLAATLTPVAGEHCARCDDTAEVPCPACKGRERGCRECDRTGSAWCACRPAKDAAALIRGRAYAGGLLRILRGVLHHVGAGAPCALWTIAVERTEPRHTDAALIVDADGIRMTIAAKDPGTPGTELAL